MDGNLRKAAEVAERYISGDWDRWYWEQLVSDISKDLQLGASCAAVAMVGQKCREEFGASRGRRNERLTPERVASLVLFELSCRQALGAEVADPQLSDDVRWKPIKDALAEFMSYLSQRIPALTVQHGNDRNWTDDEYRRQWPRFASKKGVYIIFDRDGNLAYIGSATACFDIRVWSHDEKVDRRWTDLIVIGEQYAFLAPALELFLIDKLKPLQNVAHRRC